MVRSIFMDRTGQTSIQTHMTKALVYQLTNPLQDLTLSESKKISYESFGYQPRGSPQASKHLYLFFF